MNAQPPRHLDWQACLNVRELGGYPTRAGGETRWQAFLRADSLHNLTAAGQEALLTYGVAHVIDLRTPGEVVRHPNPFAGAHTDGRPRYHHLSLVDEAVAAGVAAIDAAPSPAQIYWALLDHFGHNIAAVFRALDAAGPGAILFHCHAGKDRTGVIAALLLALAGVPAEVIAADYALSDRYIQPLYDRERAKAPAGAQERERMERMLVSAPEYMADTLAYLEREYGGAAAYLEMQGFGRAGQVRLRARLTGAAEEG